MVPQWIIEKKRDGHALSEDEIREFIGAYAAGTLPDYQMAALAMAIYFQGMSFDEISTLTDAMMRSGELVDTSVLSCPKADKHSTGGIGDKVSLILAPLVACCGVAVPMLSGRGLGITGGTLDKLESIPGYRTGLSIDEFLRILADVGCSIMGQTATLAPADKKLYALRDVTATVPSIPLISASIMSKKLAEGMDALVLDVKCGSGAFMKDQDQARELARTMVEVGARMGKGMAALITDMDQPLGCTAGNALEVRETLDALNGEGPDDLMQITLALAGEMLVLTGRAPDLQTATTLLQAQLDSGAALRTFVEMVAAHGGDVDWIADPALLPTAPIQEPYPARSSGFVHRVDAEAVGKACMLLGAGRRRVEDDINHAVGISDLVKIGQTVAQGDPLLVIHAADQASLQQARRLLDDGIVVEPTPIAARPLILERLTPEAAPA